MGGAEKETKREVTGVVTCLLMLPVMYISDVEEVKVGSCGNEDAVKRVEFLLIQDTMTFKK